MHDPTAVKRVGLPVCRGEKSPVPMNNTKEGQLLVPVP